MALTNTQVAQDVQTSFFLEGIEVLACTNNICITRIIELVEQGKEAENVFEEIIPESFLNLGKDTEI